MLPVCCHKLFPDSTWTINYRFNKKVSILYLFVLNVSLLIKMNDCWCVSKFEFSGSVIAHHKQYSREIGRAGNRNGVDVLVCFLWCSGVDVLVCFLWCCLVFGVRALVVGALVLGVFWFPCFGSGFWFCGLMGLFGLVCFDTGLTITHVPVCVCLMICAVCQHEIRFRYAWLFYLCCMS